MRSTWRISKPLRYGISATVLASLGATRLAEWLLRRALVAALQRGDPEQIADIYSAQAFVAERRGDKTRAVALLEKAIRLQPGNDVYHCELGVLYKDQEDYATATSHLDEARRLLDLGASPEFRAWLEAELRECREKGSSPKTKLGQ